MNVDFRYQSIEINKEKSCDLMIDLSIITDYYRLL